MNAFLLVRHAPTFQDSTQPSNQWKVAEEAERACQELATKIQPVEPTLIITSTEAKARATGEFLAEALRLYSFTADGLEEHDRTGVPYVKDDQVWQATLKSLFNEPQKRVLGKETATEALERFEAALKRELDAHKDDVPILVSHATVISLFVARHNNLDPYAFWQTVKMPEALLLRRPDFALLERY